MCLSVSYWSTSPIPDRRWPPCARAETGRTITVIEGDHGSWYCHPKPARHPAPCSGLIDIQARAGGDARIGRRLYPLLVEAGFRQGSRDPSHGLRGRFPAGTGGRISKNTFIAMVEGVREKAFR